MANFTLIRSQSPLGTVTRADWVVEAKARHGVITVVPSGVAKGATAARFGSGPPYTYELAPIPVLLADGFDQLIDDLGTSFWDGHALAQDVIDTTKDTAKDLIDDATNGNGVPSLLDVIAGAVGLPKPLVIGVALVAGYAMLHSLGVVPSFARLVKSK